MRNARKYPRFSARSQLPLKTTLIQAIAVGTMFSCTPLRPLADRGSDVVDGSLGEDRVRVDDDAPSTPMDIVAVVDAADVSLVEIATDSPSVDGVGPSDVPTVDAFGPCTVGHRRVGGACIARDCEQVRTDLGGAFRDNTDYPIAPTEGQPSVNVRCVVVGARAESYLALPAGPAHNFHFVPCGNDCAYVGYGWSHVRLVFGANGVDGAVAIDPRDTRFRQDMTIVNPLNDQCTMDLPSCQNERRAANVFGTAFPGGTLGPGTASGVRASLEGTPFRFQSSLFARFSPLWEEQSAMYVRRSQQAFELQNTQRTTPTTWDLASPETVRFDLEWVPANAMQNFGTSCANPIPLKFAPYANGVPIGFRPNRDNRNTFVEAGIPGEDPTLHCARAMGGEPAGVVTRYVSLTIPPRTTFTFNVQAFAPNPVGALPPAAYVRVIDRCGACVAQTAGTPYGFGSTEVNNLQNATDNPVTRIFALTFATEARSIRYLIDRIVP